MEGREGEKEVEEGGALLDFSAVGIVCIWWNESCGSAADFLLGAAINAGKDDQMEGGLEGEIGPELDLKEEGVVVDLFEFMLDNNKSKRLIHRNLQHLFVSAAKIMILKWKWLLISEHKLH